MPARRPTDPIDYAWFEIHFSKLEKEHALILKRLDDLQPRYLTPKLEAAVNAVSIQAIKIDRKVPDITLPPGKTTSQPPKG